MTDKQEKILQSALTLFAEYGYAATSTSKVAKAAGVSEGLIFRHFENKEGLLKAIMEHGREVAYREYASVLAKSDPRAVVQGILELPFRMSAEHYHFWKLIYALKWQTETYDHSFAAPLRHALTDAFTKLDYANPAAEAEVVITLIDGLAVSVLLRRPDDLDAVRQSILTKYEIS